MKPKKLFVIPFLFFVSSIFVGCVDESEPVYYFWDEPAIVDNLEDTDPIIRTAHGKFVAPGLAGEEVEKGDILWSQFIVDMENQGNNDPLVATSFRYDKLNKKEIDLPETAEVFNEFLSNDYSEPFQLAELYNTYIDRYLFFGFYPKDNSETKFAYELVCNPEIENSNGYPTLYIRAKKYTEGDEGKGIWLNDGKGRIIAVFDMTEFIDKYGKDLDDDTKSVKFNLKYKIGTVGEGSEDIYREFVSNPIAWTVK
ncbi:hypothetical protein LJC52_01565 [Bacteroidales bacterium OttesenSCG-928-A17]|nr:hypothetical protein [Bacteroidales bacterium OttesenSCG-928-A17]